MTAATPLSLPPGPLPPRVPDGPVDRPRDNHFNFLRLLFAALVIVGHSPELIDGNRTREPLTRLFGTLSLGELAVGAFFFISGYLIVQSWLLTSGLGAFVKKRLLRILPAFIVASLLSAFVIPLMVADAGSYFALFNWRVYLLSLLQIRAPVVPDVFAEPYPTINAPLWTIAFELRCYAWVAILGSLGVLDRRWPWLALTVLVLAGRLIVNDAYEIQWPPFAFMFGTVQEFSHLACYFFTGGCFFLYRDRLKPSLPIALACAVVLSVALHHPRLVDIALPALGGYVLIWFAHLRLPILDRFKTGADISYGLYLYGWPVQKLVIHTLGAVPPTVVTAVALPLAAVCGLASWRMIERPFLKLKGGRPVDEKASPAVSHAVPAPHRQRTQTST